VFSALALFHRRVRRVVSPCRQTLALQMWVSPNLLRTQFIIPMGHQHFTIACSAPGSATVYTSLGVSSGQTFAISGSATGAFKYVGGGAAGRYITTTVPCFVIADGSLSGGDEVVIWGYD
jgi:hypothetical protein